MSNPIFDTVEHDLGEIRARLTGHLDTDIDTMRRVWQQITRHGSTQPYDQPGGAADAAETPTPKGPAVSLAAFAADLRNDLAALQVNAENDTSRVKTAIEQKLPEIERIGAMFDNDPLVQLAIGEVVPAPLRQLAADAVTTLVKAFGAAPASVAAPAAADDAPAPQANVSGIAQ